MEFKKYNDIENSYRQKFIERFKERYPEINNIKFVALEKLNGANFQIALNSDDINYCTRKRILDSNSNFYQWQNAIKKLNLNKLIEFTKNINAEVRLYGELFGTGVNKGVKYQDEKLIKFFDINVNGVYYDFTTFEKLMNDFDLPIVPVVDRNITLKELLDYEVETLNSKILNIPQNVAEGIVGRPLHEEIFVGYDRFILKKKSKKFKENSKKNHKKPKPVDPLVDFWKPLVLEYVTETRLNGLYSKMGLIEFPKQIGEYIKEYILDVRKDFIKDHPEYEKVGLTKKQDKNIFNFSKIVVKWINNSL